MHLKAFLNFLPCYSADAFWIMKQSLVPADLPSAQGHPADKFAVRQF